MERANVKFLVINMILLRYPILAGTNSCIFNRRASLRDSRQKSINGALTLRGCAPNAACTHCRVIEFV